MTTIRTLAALACLSLAFTPAVVQATEQDADHTGIWKYYVPKGVKGELDNYDPIGLIAGVLIKTDCTYNWHADDGKMYCFATPTSLVYFEAWPKTYIKQATDALHQLSPGS